MLRFFVPVVVGRGVVMWGDKGASYLHIHVHAYRPVCRLYQTNKHAHSSYTYTMLILYHGYIAENSLLGQKQP